MLADHCVNEDNKNGSLRFRGGGTMILITFMVKDSKKYVATGGWGYSSFDQNGKPSDDAGMKACFPCHQAVKERDFIFTRYAP
jgi:hypothetical protein